MSRTRYVDETRRSAISHNVISQEPRVPTSQAASALNPQAMKRFVLATGGRLDALS